MSSSHPLGSLLAPLVIQPVQTTNQDAWWKWVAIGLIVLIVLPAAALIVLTVRSWLVDN